MRSDNGQSRGFGFVSFQTPSQATAALLAMNGAMLGNKQVQVRLHEPKQLRQEKLAQRFSHGQGPQSPTHTGGAGGSKQLNNMSGATSPAISDGGGMGEGSPVGRDRRGSGSYYNVRITIT